MKCPKCSKEYDDSFKFCPECAESNPQVAQQPTTRIEQSVSPSEIKTTPAVPPLPPRKGGLKKSWSNLPAFGKVFLIVGMIVVLAFVVVVAVVEGKKETNSSKFTQIGAYSPAGAFDAGLEADSYYVANPTKSEIRQFCEGQKEENLGRLKDLNRSLNVSFYDDEAHTPNYTQGYDPSDESLDQYRIADYVINPLGGGADEVTFYKEIPE